MTPTLTPKLSLTEQRMVRMWSATHFGGDWFDLNKTLWEIAQMMVAQELPAIADDFCLLARVALQRAIDDMADKKMKVAA